MKLVPIVFVIGFLSTSAYSFEPPQNFESARCIDNSFNSTIVDATQNMKKIASSNDVPMKFSFEEPMGTIFKGWIKSNSDEIIGAKYESHTVVVTPLNRKYIHKCITEHSLSCEVGGSACFRVD